MLYQLSYTHQVLPVSGSADHRTCSRRVLVTTHLPDARRPIRHDGPVTTPHRSAPPFVPVITAIIALAAMLAALVATAGPASAHARLDNSSPRDGSTLTATPPEVMLRFNEPIKSGLNQVTVTSGSTDATEGELEVDGATVYQPLKSSLPAGTYKVSYKVVSADGHPISGSLSFRYAPPGGDEGPVEEPGGEGTPPATSTTTTSSSSSTSAPTASTSAPSTTSATAPSSSTSEPTSSSTSEPSSTTSSSSSSTTGDGETEPSQRPTSSSTTAAVPAQDDTSDDGGVPTWVWAAIIGGLLVVGAAVGLLARRRGDDGDDEDIHLEEWRG
ncbi:MAG TPA: hypothetical protein DER11_05910 [Janibacter terrae]|nr:hypothetical protein [Janibacter terrae]